MSNSYSLVYSQDGMITGTVIDNADSKPLEFARIRLFNSIDSSLIDGTISAINGQFKLIDVKYGQYYLDVNFIGYKANLISDLSLTKDKNQIFIDSIKLISSNELKGVEVVAEQRFSETKIDKKIFNADQSIASKGGTGLDLLKEIPSLTIDENDNILIRGDANITVLVDGRPISMNASDFLKQIPASAIDKIELITNPSAKFDPEGMSGIINIVMKKNKMKGFNGNIHTNFGYGSLPKMSTGIGINYRNSKINLYANYNYSYRKMWFGGSLKRDVLLADSSWNRLRSEDLGGRLNTSHYVKAGFDYFINDKNTFYLSGTVYKGYNLGGREINYQDLNSSLVVSSFSDRIGEIDVESQSFGFNTGWQKTFKESGHTLDIDLNYNNSPSLAFEDLSHLFYNDFQEQYLSNYQSTRDEKDKDILLGKIDYTLPINDSLILEAGFHYTNRNANTLFHSQSGNVLELLEDDFNLNNEFDYNQVTYATYFTLGKQFNKLGTKIGLRVEQTETQSLLINTNQAFDNDYLKFFPSVHLSYKLTETSELMASYSKRINRPETYQLNPFSNFSDVLTLEKGNPFLKPEIIHVNEISYLKYWKKMNISSTVYYRLITDLIRRNLSYEGVVSTVDYRNLGKSSLTGTDLTLTYLPVKGVRIISSSSLWITSTKEVEFTNGERINYIGFNTSLRGSVQFKKGYSAQVWASFSPRQDVLQGFITPNYGGGIAVSKQVLKKRGNISLSATDILNTRQFTFVSQGISNYYFKSQRGWESRVVYLSFRYNFGKMVKGQEKRKSKNNGSNDEKSIPDMQ